MGIGGVTFGGLASGIDTKAVIDAIMAVERRPIQRLESRQSDLNSRKAALDEMRSKLDSFLASLRDLSSTSTLNSKIATVSNEDALGVTAGTAAELGQYSIDVVQLAAAQKIAGNGVADSGICRWTKGCWRPRGGRSASWTWRPPWPAWPSSTGAGPRWR